MARTDRCEEKLAPLTLQVPCAAQKTTCPKKNAQQTASTPGRGLNSAPRTLAALTGRPFPQQSAKLAVPARTRRREAKQLQAPQETQRAVQKTKSMSDLPQETAPAFGRLLKRVVETACQPRKRHPIPAASALHCQYHMPAQQR